MNKLARIMEDLIEVQAQVGAIYEAHIENPSLQNGMAEDRVFAKKRKLERDLTAIEDEIAEKFPCNVSGWPNQ